MNKLITITEKEGKKLVSAKELHCFLESKRDFSNWFSYKTDQYDFKEGLDFTTILLESTGGRPSKDYAITLNMAKELSMVENNDKGREARKYFIECEKQATQPQLSKELQSIIMLDQRTVAFEKRMDKLESDMPLFNVECKDLQALVRKTGISALGGYKSKAYNSNSIRCKVYSDIQQQLKREFGVTRYEGIKRSQLDIAKTIVGAYKIPMALGIEIHIANNQVAFN